MAIITLRITVRRAEGRNKVDPLDIAQNLGQIVEELEAFEVVDSEGEDATYEVTRVELVYRQAEMASVSPADVLLCRWCLTPVPQEPAARPKLYCSDAHRQAAYRHRNNLA